MVDQTLDAPLPNGSPPAPSPADGSPSQEATSQFHPLIWVVCLLLIGAGVFFRYDNLRNQPIWHDEALQLLHSGGTTLGAEQTSLQNHIVTFGELSKNALENGEHKKFTEIFPAIYYDQPEHAPLSFLSMHFWGNKFGWNVASMRNMCVLFGVLQLPAAFILGWELTGSILGGIIATALFACSPLVVHYSQELRDYSFTTFFSLSANAAFLRAYRKKLCIEWLLYPIFASLAIYSSILAYFTLLAHGCYVIWSDQIKIQKDGLALSVSATCFIASVVAVLAATAPLSWIILTNLDRIAALTSWVAVPLPGGELINAILFNPSQVFLWLQSAKPELQNSLLAFLFCIETIAVLAVFMQKQKSSFRFLVCLLIPVALSVWLPDLIMGGQRSLYSKYYIAAPTAILFFCAVALSGAISSRAPGVRFIGGLGLALVTACQIWSDFDLVHLTERGMIGHQWLAPVRQTLREDPRALLVSSNTDENTNLIQICALTQSTPATIKLLWLENDSLATLPKDSEQFYVFNPRPGLVRAIRDGGYRLSPVGKMDYFFLAKLNPAPLVVPAAKVGTGTIPGFKKDQGSEQK